MVLLTLCGCAEVNYSQEGKSARETERDWFNCEDKVLKEHHGLTNLSAKEKESLMNDCMKEEGYRVKSEQNIR
jgi:hypothetical protein